MTSINLRKAAEIQEKIEKLQADLDALLEIENSTESVTESESELPMDIGRKRGRKPSSAVSIPNSRSS
jgi:hypothetical protein